MPLLIGTSGWQYRSWRETFYPSGVAQARWLEHYAARFQTVEVNNAFYRLPEARTFADWARRTPDDFVVAVKMSRYLTHVRRLHQPAEPVQLFLSRARHLGAKLGPVLLQLPPTLRADTGALDATLSCFPSDVRVAVELRHESWFTEETAGLLADHGAALCLADGPRLRTPLWRTADWAYVRFHEGRATPRPCYGRTALSSWARRLAEVWGSDADTFAFFNNDERCCAVRDATVLATTGRGAGLRPTRVPSADEVRVS
ncbi:MAG: DUF72 domain-containing protein [Actinobacteria bacterium]|nr:MAG: DUF72 domain-containing protein [Actinomycetota bacterium]